MCFQFFEEEARNFLGMTIWSYKILNARKYWNLDIRAYTRRLMSSFHWYGLKLEMKAPKSGTSLITFRSLTSSSLLDLRYYNCTSSMTSIFLTVCKPQEGLLARRL